jgi:lantibiotic biosynthesis protein
VSAFLEHACTIARRICRDAIWADGSCNWIGPSIDSFNVRDVRQKSFGPDLYSGTSGVALFLASVAQQGHERLMRKTAEGAAHHAYSRANDVPPSLRIGMYSGTIGIAWSLIRVGELLGAGAWQERGIALLDQIDVDIADAGLDVMSGYAGAIPVLLELSRLYARPAWAELALRWGNQLVRAAAKSSEGWSWKMIGPPERAGQRNLTGFSHGTAGVGWALLELSEITHESRFRNAAEEAFLYERSHYNAENENWPDFRDFLRQPGLSTTPVFGTAWCHGAPGIALSRLRAWHLTGSPQARKEAEIAVRTTKRILEAPDAARSGFSLCHGCAGNADVLLEAGRSLTAPDLREVAEKIGYAGIEQFESQRLPWPCGLPGAGETKNLMLGTAGIGYFYLRLHDRETPTVLIIPSPRHPGLAAAQGT